VPVLKLAIDSDQVILLHNAFQLENRILFLSLELLSFTLNKLIFKEKLLQLLCRILNFFGEAFLVVGALGYWLALVFLLV